MNRRLFLKGLFASVSTALTSLPALSFIESESIVEPKINIASPDGWDIDYTTKDITCTDNADYKTVLEFHRWLQDLSDREMFSGDVLDITSDTPSERSTDNIITLKNGFTIDEHASQFLYDGSIIQKNGEEIYDGYVNYTMTPDINIHIYQGKQKILKSWWNTSTGGINADVSKNISHRFLLKNDGKEIHAVGYNNPNIEMKYFNIKKPTRGNNIMAV